MTPPNKISLVLADIDGTLVTKEKMLTERTIDAVRKIHERGIPFAITSSRPPQGMAMLFGPLQITTPIAGFNGGLWIKPDTRQVLEEHVLPDALVPQIVALMEHHQIHVWVFRGNDWFVRNAHGPHVERESHTVQFAPHVVDSFDGLLTNVAKIVGVSDDYEAVARADADAQAAFGSLVSATRSQPYYLDVTHLDANKGAVARRLCELLHVPQAELVTVGDQKNDVRMFHEAGFSIAMGNAPDEVKAEASATTDTNENDGFAKAIEKFVLKETQ